MLVPFAACYPVIFKLLFSNGHILVELFGQPGVMQAKKVIDHRWLASREGARGRAGGGSSGERESEELDRYLRLRGQNKGKHDAAATAHIYYRTLKNELLASHDDDVAKVENWDREEEMMQPQATAFIKHRRG